MLWTVHDFFLATLVGAACWSDIRTQRIPNVLNGPMMLIGLLLSTVIAPQPLVGFAESLAAWGLALVLGIVGWRGLGAIRPGDVKMLMAAATMLGPEATVRAALFLYALGLPYGLVMLAVKGRMKNLQNFARFYLLKQGEKPEATLVAYAPMVGIAVFLGRHWAWPDLW